MALVRLKSGMMVPIPVAPSSMDSPFSVIDSPPAEFALFLPIWTEYATGMLTVLLLAAPTRSWSSGGFIGTRKILDARVLLSGEGLRLVAIGAIAWLFVLQDDDFVWLRRRRCPTMRQKQTL
ncbi:hypothetical protein V8F06_011069 [Rhypophila decipiens]